MIVVDASVLTEIFLQTASALTIRSRLYGRGETLHAPHLVEVEVAHAVRRLVFNGEAEEARGRNALEELASAPLRLYPHTQLLPRIWQLRSNVSAYDATYIALAEALDATLLTRDERLARAPGHGARIEVV